MVHKRCITSRAYCSRWCLVSILRCLLASNSYKKSWFFRWWSSYLNGMNGQLPLILAGYFLFSSLLQNNLFATNLLVLLLELILSFHHLITLLSSQFIQTVIDFFLAITKPLQALIMLLFHLYLLFLQSLLHVLLRLWVSLLKRQLSKVLNLTLSTKFTYSIFLTFSWNYRILASLSCYRMFDFCPRLVEIFWSLPCRSNSFYLLRRSRSSSMICFLFCHRRVSSSIRYKLFSNSYYRFVLTSLSFSSRKCYISAFYWWRNFISSIFRFSNYRIFSSFDF